MTNKYEIYKCGECGNLVEKLIDNQNEMICCEKPMQKLEALKKDSSIEKHVPFIEETENGILVKIGENEKHPMTPEHYIVFIEVIMKNNKILRQYLTPNDEPEAEFIGIKKEEIEVAREYCNLHGLWKN